MTVPAVVFDLDGTLVDTAPDLMGATNHVLSLIGRRAISMAEVRAFVGHGAKALIARGAAATGEPLDDVSLRHYYAEFVRYYEAHIAESSSPFPGAIDLLEQLQANDIKIGICTNKLEGLSRKLIEELGLGRFFGAIVGPDTLSIGKPDAAPYRETIRQLGAGRSLMVGDSETDVLTARAAGVPVIAVSFGYTREPVSNYSPDAIVDHFDQLWPLIRREFAI